jgi:hypothetical protein
MKPFRYLSLLGALAALGTLTPGAAAADSFRLDRIGVVRFEESGPNRLQRHSGLLMFDGRTQWQSRFEMDRPANVPEWILGRTLVLREAWLAYRSLGYTALANFQLGAFSVAVRVGDSEYWVAEPNPDSTFADGNMINISTRARLGGAGESIVAGFVIEGRPRWVLIRGIGPGLAGLGVNGVLADPIIGVRKGQTIFHYNDNWSDRPDAAEIRAAAAQVGAFPLADGSRDSAMLVELNPGAYTVSVEAAGPAIGGGEVLVEVYRVPELN